MASKPKKAREEISAGKNQGGRRKLDDADRRDTLVRVLVNVAEYAELQKAAKLAHVPLSTWLRMIGLERAQALIYEKEAARKRDEQ